MVITIVLAVFIHLEQKIKILLQKIYTCHNNPEKLLTVKNILAVIHYSNTNHLIATKIYMIITGTKIV